MVGGLVFGWEDDIAFPFHAVKYVTVHTQTACVCISAHGSIGTWRKNGWASMNYFQSKIANLGGSCEVCVGCFTWRPQRVACSLGREDPGFGGGGMLSEGHFITNCKFFHCEWRAYHRPLSVCSCTHRTIKSCLYCGAFLDTLSH